MLAIKGLARFAATAGGRSVAGVRFASTVGGALDEAVGRLPHKEALRSVKQDVRYSFQELRAVVDEVANGLADLKFAQGDVLAVWLPNSAENVRGTALAVDLQALELFSDRPVLVSCR